MLASDGRDTKETGHARQSSLAFDGFNTLLLVVSSFLLVATAAAYSGGIVIIAVVTHWAETLEGRA